MVTGAPNNGESVVEAWTPLDDVIVSDVVEEEGVLVTGVMTASIK